MPRKSAKKAARGFHKSADDVLAFAQAAGLSFSGLTKQQVSWAYDFAIIRLYRDFEILMLEALVTAVNNDTATISAQTGIDFPTHLTDEVCEYLIIGTGYFDFKGRSGLLRTLKKYVPSSHYLVAVVKKSQYKTPLEQLIALRNFAAHGSAVAKTAAMKATGASALSTSGAWLKIGDRLNRIADPLKQLADDIEAAAPY